ncbi:MAG TPA: CHRD domain-containing protein [Burkholderiales bacterium]|nr:CHRD domain-containing protein [Burkholderiales bacterium]
MKVKAALVLGILALAVAPFASAQNRISGSLVSFEEVPSVSSVATGKFDAQINANETAIDWELSYADLEGAVQQAHIHFGQTAVNGGITVFLCTNLGNGPAGTQPCPAPPATISGTILAADVSPNIPATAAARTQGINTGELAELIRAIRAGVTYVNVHSTLWPGGEIRSQVGPGHSH